MTKNAEIKPIKTSFCACCGKPVRWEVPANWANRNEEFCPDCKQYAAKVVTLEMQIEALQREASGKATDAMAQVKIEQLVKERDVSIRILDTIRVGVEGEMQRITQQNAHYKIAKFASN